MIEVKKLSKVIGKKAIIGDLSFSFPETGLICLLGPSGSGKSTLINMLGMIDSDYTGTLLIDGVDPRALKEPELAKFRLDKVSMVFQNYNLMSKMNVHDNANFTSDLRYKRSRTDRIKSTKFYLNMLDLPEISTKICGKLSGGEQQRVAIMRALNGERKIFLLDEPTAALDENASAALFQKLSQLGRDNLVIVGTHNEDLAAQFATQIVRLKDGKIMATILRDAEDGPRIQRFRNQPRRPRDIFPISLISKHYTSNQKAHRWRSLIGTFVTSVSLFSIGLSTLLSETINQSVTNALSQTIDENQIIVSKRSEPDYDFPLIGVAKGELEEIRQTYPVAITSLGARYHDNLENIFRDENVFYLDMPGPRFILDGLQIRDVTEFQNLTTLEADLDFYPRLPFVLDPREIVVALSNLEMNYLCFHLQIDRSFHSLGYYLENNGGLPVALSLKNRDWNFEIVQSFMIVAVTKAEETSIMHYDNLWNEIVMEEILPFPSSLHLTRLEANPWTLKKNYYLAVKDAEIFLRQFRADQAFEKYVIEKSGPKLLSFFYNESNCLQPSVLAQISRLDATIRNPIFSTYGFYGIYGAEILSGFSRPTFFAGTPERADYIHDTLTNINVQSEEIVFPKDEHVAAGYFLNPDPPVRFKILDIEAISSGNAPNSINEIIVSTGLLRALGFFEFRAMLPLFMEFVFQETIHNGRIFRDIRRTQLEIVGVIESPNPIIYHYQHWLLDFPLLTLELPAQTLMINNITYQSDVEIDMTYVAFLNGAFSDLSFVSPTNDIQVGLQEVTSALRNVLLIFAVTSLIMAFILLTVSMLMSFIELRRELGLMRVNGVSVNGVRKYIICNCFFFIGRSLILALGELLIVGIILNLLLSDLLHTTINMVFSFFPFLLVFVSAFLFATVLALFMTIYWRNLGPLRLLQK